MRFSLTAALVLSASLTACNDGRSDPPQPQPVAGLQATVSVPMRGNGKLDILFMVDNSASMAAMQDELKRRFGDLVAALTGVGTGAPLDLHLGVVTSDYGAGDQDNRASGCSQSPGGDLGHLIAIGKAADPSCQAPVGVPFVEYSVSADGVIRSNLPGGSTPASLVTTFTCMASGIADDGSFGGCGFEHQLESVYAALHGDAITSGFLRDDAALSIVFLTNEDDGSAAPDAHMYENSASADASYGAYDTFRQTAWGVICDGASSPYDQSTGPLSGCLPISNPGGDPSLEYDVSRYVSFFTQPRSRGGLKDSAWDVSLVEIAAPTTPFEIVLAQVGTGSGQGVDPAYVPCALLDSSCEARLQHSCQNASDPAFFGDPPVRLDAVVQQATIHQVESICGDDPTATPSFTVAMSNAGQLMNTQRSGGCMFQAVVDAQHPQCAVTLHQEATDIAVPSCDGGEMPCWQLVTDAGCPSVLDLGTGKRVQERLTLVGADPSLPVDALCTVYDR